MARAMERPRTVVDPVRLKKLYAIMQSVERKIGGGEGVEGLYGSITCGGLQKILECFTEQCQMGRSSVFVDIGAGIGRPMLHAMLFTIGYAYGVEVDSVKCEKGEAFIRQTLAALHNREGVGPKPVEPQIHCCDIQNVTQLDPASHAYSFWEGVPPAAKEAFGRLFALSETLQAVAVVQRAFRGLDPATYMARLGFGALRLESSFPVSMTGSGRKFRAYVFTKQTMTQQMQAASSESLKRCGTAKESGVTSLVQQQLTAIFPKVKSTVQECDRSLKGRACLVDVVGTGRRGPLHDEESGDSPRWYVEAARPTYAVEHIPAPTARALRVANRRLHKSQRLLLTAKSPEQKASAMRPLRIENFLRHQKSGVAKCKESLHEIDRRVGKSGACS